MGLFKHKKKGSSIEDAVAVEQLFLDENFREELRNHGRLYFEKVINENGALFKRDLDATIGEVNSQLKEQVITKLDASIGEINFELKDHVTKQLDEQFAEYGKAMKDAQDLAMRSLTQSTQTLQEQHKQLAETLQKTISSQEAILNGVFDESKSQIAAMKEAQETALKSLTDSAQAIEDQRKELAETLKATIAKQEEAFISVFQENMAQIIEHYLLGALGDQYDLKSQLPSIIKQMEANKDAIVGDMKL